MQLPVRRRPRLDDDGRGHSATSFRGLLDRFYSMASAVVFDHDGSVDKFVGDELVAMFFPLLSGERHAARTVEAARSLLRGDRSRRRRWSVGAARRRRAYRSRLGRSGG